jgi:peptidyl-prolyl cis-trans isomerase B (cyclophilin B)
MGDIKLRFFPEQAPKAVENFITHAKNGYYDGVIFHRVINDFMIQGGDPEGTGMGGESIWGAGFENEFDLSVRNFRGALSMAHSAQPNSNGSQFFIVQNNNLNPQYVSMFEELRGKQDEVVTESEEGTVYNRDLMPVEVIDEYIKNGGTPHLDALFNPDGHTVFGHVIEGMDVVDAIAALPVVDAAAENHQPVEDVVINSISFEIAP